MAGLVDGELIQGQMRKARRICRSRLDQARLEVHAATIGRRIVLTRNYFPKPFA
jgi:hypothetical protein